MATTSDISRGVILKLDGSLYSVVEFGENKTARAAAKVWAKLKGVDNKRSIEKTWNSGETIYPVRVEKRAFQFLYKDESGFNLMNNETFEQIALGEEMIDAPQFLKDGSEVFVFINTETDQAIGAELPEKIVVKITYCEPGFKRRYGYPCFKSSYRRNRRNCNGSFICGGRGINPRKYQVW